MQLLIILIICACSMISKENLKKHGLQQQQQAKMLSKISGQKKVIEDVDEGVELFKRVLKGKKTLLILDNVDKREQLQKLARECEWVGSGSRIIITTRDLHLVKRHGVERIYEMEGLNQVESRDLLSWNAFRNMQVDESYKDVMEDVISYASGLPFALEIIGSELYGKNVREWKSMLNGCKSIPHNKIQQILEVSYHGLQEQGRDAFLDIACFYNRKALEYVKKMVGNAHDFDPNYQIGVLLDKCLIKIDDYGCIKMHDLVQDMGREIVRQESPKNPRKRSRIWSSKDILHVLERSEGTSEVIVIIQVERFKCIEIDWDGTAFKSTKNLKILILENAKFSQGPKYLPNSLAVLRWRGYPSSSFSHGFHPKHLVELDLGGSNFNSIMEIVTKLILQKANVSVLNFTGCKYIEKIPNLSGLPCLKELQLFECTNLIEVDNSVGQLPKLETLFVASCYELRTFPSELNTPSLVELDLGLCRNLNSFPEIVTREMKISTLLLNATGIDKLPPSVENLTNLEWLYIRLDSRIRAMKLPSSIFMLPNLEDISFAGEDDELLMEVESLINPNMSYLELTHCNISSENLRIYLAAFPNVRLLDLTGSDLTILLACIEDCLFLDELVLYKCKQLIEVEKVPPSIKKLSVGDCTSMSSESRKLLLSQELLAFVVPMNCEYTPKPEAHFYVLGGSIPEWFDHYSKGPSISFWFLDQYFPTYLIICAIVEVKKGFYCGEVDKEVFINEEAYIF